MAHEPVTDAEWTIIERARRETLTDAPALFGLLKAVQYVNSRKIDGAFVECGVYRAGSALTMARQCVLDGSIDRDFYLYDTFEGCPAPTDHDGVIFGGTRAADLWQQALDDPTAAWFRETLGVATANIAETEYPLDRVRFVQGRVEETIPDVAPDRIALLRLDTDWYESTKHEMHHLWPRLVPGGVVVVDDYGWFESSRRAFEEYFEETGAARPLMNRLNVSVRIGVKT